MIALHGQKVSLVEVGKHVEERVDLKQGFKELVVLIGVD